jgi:hypothetical protein
MKTLTRKASLIYPVLRSRIILMRFWVLQLRLLPYYPVYAMTVFLNKQKKRTIFLRISSDLIRYQYGIKMNQKSKKLCL